MVADQSAGADDGSHRLLIVPCVVVVLVLVLLVTACSAVSGAGDRDAADPSGVAGGAAGGSAGEDAEEVPGGSDGEGAGEIAEPVMAGDGRMIQPEGHTGLWFETEPADPLERLVYESQRFIGQPVTLEPIGDRALLPEWEDMPDPCHPEVLRRMGELGLEIDIEVAVGPGAVLCPVFGSAGLGSEIFSEVFEWGIVEDPSLYSDPREKDLIPIHGYHRYGGGLEESVLGCAAASINIIDGYSAIATIASQHENSECQKSVMVLQLSINSLGGEVNVEV